MYLSTAEPHFYDHEEIVWRQKGRVFQEDREGRVRNGQQIQ